MEPRDRTGLMLLAGGVGLALLNLLGAALGWAVAPWRPALSGVLMAAGLALLAVGVMARMREPDE